MRRNYGRSSLPSSRVALHVLLAFFLVVCSSSFVSGQGYTLPEEDNIFSFRTATGKTISLSRDKQNRYIIYRLGAGKKVEFEFPGKTKESWKEFKYSFWLRGGGIANEGVDLNYVYFTNGDFLYVIYDTYFAHGNRQQTGVKVINLITGQTTNLAGVISTRKGSLTGFRDNGQLEIGDELFD